LCCSRSNCNEIVSNAVSHILADNPFVTSHELSKSLQQELNVQLASSTVRAYLKRLGYSRKRPTRIPETPIIQEQRRAFSSVAHAIAPHSVLSIDETALYFHMSPLMGYSKRGTRIRPSLHPNYRHRLTLLMAVSSTGIVHWQVMRGGTNAQDLVNFIMDDKIQTASQTNIFLDNAAFHKTLAVREAARQTGKTLVFLSPYSPQFQPYATS
jgi:arginine repressor